MKQSYTTPRLTVFGDVNSITQKPGHNFGNNFGLSCGNGNCGFPNGPFGNHGNKKKKKWH